MSSLDNHDANKVRENGPSTECEILFFVLTTATPFNALLYDSPFDHSWDIL